MFSQRPFFFRIVDALLEAESDFRIKEKKISEAVSDLQIYLQLTGSPLKYF